MSYFDRPDSPPPRAPSPEQVHTPLPSPHQRRRNQARSPLSPPGLAPPRTLLQSRSCDQLSRDTLHPTLKRRTRSNLEPNEPTAARSHRRTTSVSIPSPPSSSRSSRVGSPAPPVPPLPRSPPLFKPHIRSHVSPIYLPELSDLSPEPTPVFPPPPPPPAEKKSIRRLPSLFSVSSAPGSISPSGKTSSESTHSASTMPSVPQEKEAPTPIKQRSTVAMTCLKFFTLNRHSSNKNLRAATVNPPTAQC